MKKLFLTLVFVFIAPLSYADCQSTWGGEIICWGVVGIDVKTGQTTWVTNHYNPTEAVKLAKKSCPTCQTIYFKDQCAAISYSPSLKVYGYHLSQDINYAAEQATNKCQQEYRTIFQANARANTRANARTSAPRDNRRSGPAVLDPEPKSYDCKIAVAKCTSVYTVTYY